MKNVLRSIVNFYNSNAKFHSFVLALEYASASFVTAYLSTGSIPTSKRAWITFGVGLGGALVAALKRWIVTSLADVNLNLKANQGK